LLFASQAVSAKNLTFVAGIFSNGYSSPPVNYNQFIKESSKPFSDHDVVTPLG